MIISVSLFALQGRCIFLFQVSKKCDQKRLFFVFAPFVTPYWLNFEKFLLRESTFQNKTTDRISYLQLQRFPLGDDSRQFLPTKLFSLLDPLSYFYPFKPLRSSVFEKLFLMSLYIIKQNSDPNVSVIASMVLTRQLLMNQT